MTATDAPVYAADLFNDEALTDPYPHYRALRDAGPVVWLCAHGMFAVARYEDVRAVLDDPATFVSGQGVGFNDFINQAGRGTTLMSDGDEHRRQREVIGRPLTPRSLAPLQPDAQSIADTLVAELVERGTFDAVADLARVLPTSWVPDLLGWPEESRAKLIDWGAANFDALGPPNDRAHAAGEGLLEMSAYAYQLAASDLPAGSMAAQILDAAARGEIHASRCPMMIIDYLAPSLDTTVSAIGNAVWLLATHPDQWQWLRDHPDRIKQAFNECLRLESPINCFTRVAAADAVVGGTAIPSGSRILVNYASANRDERRWERPDDFDLTRDCAAQLAFGHGEHVCAGMGLARLEGHAVLSALVRQVARIELTGKPERKLNNLIRSFETLTVTVEPAPNPT